MAHHQCRQPYVSPGCGKHFSSPNCHCVNAPACNEFFARTLATMAFCPRPDWRFTFHAWSDSFTGAISRLQAHCRNNALYRAVYDCFCTLHRRSQITQLCFAGLPWQFCIDRHDCLDAALFTGAPPARQYSLLRRYE